MHLNKKKPMAMSAQHFLTRFEKVLQAVKLLDMHYEKNLEELKPRFNLQQMSKLYPSFKLLRMRHWSPSKIIFRANLMLKMLTKNSTCCNRSQSSCSNNNTNNNLYTITYNVMAMLPLPMVQTLVFAIFLVPVVDMMAHHHLFAMHVVFVNTLI